MGEGLLPFLLQRPPFAKGPQQTSEAPGAAPWSGRQAGVLKAGGNALQAEPGRPEWEGLLLSFPSTLGFTAGPQWNLRLRLLPGVSAWSTKGLAGLQELGPLYKILASEAAKIGGVA